MTRKAPMIQSTGKRHSLSRKNAEQLQSAIVSFFGIWGNSLSLRQASTPIRTGDLLITNQEKYIPGSLDQARLGHSGALSTAKIGIAGKPRSISDPK